ncbi:hypothetical protein IAU60_000197 [Kwoniella sp. DSM 27419]
MCYTPGLASNATTDVCCTDSQACTELVCGSQNATIHYENGTSYCYLDAKLAQSTWTAASNGTCNMGAIGCNLRTSGQSGAMAQGIIGGQVWMAWLGVLVMLAMWTRRG